MSLMAALLGGRGGTMAHAKAAKDEVKYECSFQRLILGSPRTGPVKIMNACASYKNARIRTPCLCAGMGKILVLFFFVLFSWTSLAQTNTIVVPPESAQVEGVGFGGILRNTEKYQVIYGADSFAAAPTDQMLITGIAWRIDGLDKGSLDVVVPRMEISASTFLGELMNVSELPEDNWGADRIQVLDGQNLHFLGNYDPTLQNFQAPVVFDQPFLYDRRAGHLMLDLETSGTYPIPRDGEWIDVAASPNLRWIGRDGTGSPLVRSGADVLQISYIPIPEPRTTGIFCIALMAAFLFKRSWGLNPPLRRTRP